MADSESQKFDEEPSKVKTDVTLLFMLLQDYISYE